MDDNKIEIKIQDNSLKNIKNISETLRIQMLNRIGKVKKIKKPRKYEEILDTLIVVSDMLIDRTNNGKWITIKEMLEFFNIEDNHLLSGRILHLNSYMKKHHKAKCKKVMRQGEKAYVAKSL